MAFRRIENADLTNKGVVGQENTPNLSAREMQEKVEEIPRAVIIPTFNQLVDALNEGSENIPASVPEGLPEGTAANVDAVLAALGAELLKRVISDDVKKLRMNEYGELEVSTDGDSFTVASSRGHAILDDQNTAFPQRRRLEFRGALVEDDAGGDKTVVYGGAVGPAGPAGPPGKDGVPGKDGTIIDLANGAFGMRVNEEGHLIVVHNDGEPAPPLSIRDGHLIYTLR